MQIGLNLTLRAINASARFSPASLFAAGEQGAWYDPSDFGTMFQDSAGTTPVTAVEQPVGLLLDKSKGLVLGPELVTNGDFSNGTTGWTLASGSATLSVVGGALRLTATNTSTSYVASPISVVAGRSYRFKALNIANSSSTGAIVIGSTAGGNDIYNSGGSTVSITVDVVFSAPVTGVIFIGLRSGNTIGGYSDYDNVSFRELPGNHAFQSTAASRPVLSARVNLLTKTEQFDDAVWTKSNATVTANVIAAPDGTVTADKLVENTATAEHRVQLDTTWVTTSLTASIYFKAAERSFAFIRLDDSGSSRYAYFNLATGTVGTVTPGLTAFIENVGGGWYKCAARFNTPTAGSGTVIFAPTTANATSSYTGDGTSGIYIWGADLRVTNTGTNLPVYQRVNTSTDYDTAGFPLYLAFDGVDDGMVTNSIDFSATDKMTVFAGVRQLSDSARGMVVELSNTFSNPGVFQLNAPFEGGFAFGSGGSVGSSIGSVPRYPAPFTAVLTGIGSISEDIKILRVNGVQATSYATDQGTGNFGNYPLYIGRRGGTSLPFNGHIYGLIVRGAASTPQQIAQAEAWMNQRTRAY